MQIVWYYLIYWYKVLKWCDFFFILTFIQKQIETKLVSPCTRYYISIFPRGVWVSACACAVCRRYVGVSGWRDVEAINFHLSGVRARVSVCVCVHVCGKSFFPINHRTGWRSTELNIKTIWFCWQCSDWGRDGSQNMVIISDMWTYEPNKWITHL